MISRGVAYRAGRLIALAAVLLGSLTYLLVLALGGAELVRIGLPATGNAVTIHDARPWLIAAVVAAVLSLAACAAAERRALALSDADQAAREARASRDELAAKLRESEKRRTRLQREQQDLRGQLAKVIQGWRSERDWNRELRQQIAQLQRKQGLLGNHDDVRKMVLELTMSLVDAEKGILLSERETRDGKLSMVCSLGFENDPQESMVAQRFATEVIERDSTIREDDTSRVDAEKRTAADEEVTNLLAIPIYLADDFAGVIVCANREEGFESLDDDVLLAVGDHAGAVLQNSRLHGDLRSAYLSTIRVLANAIELKDPELRGHSDAVSEYVLAVADRLGFEPDRREELIFASLLHDIGKLGISERILLKPATLTAEERSVIQLHPRIGYQLVRQVPALQKIAPAVLHHHERFDGDGYPGRLSGETIPLEARIIAIADAFSAMTSDRPYSRARTPEEACAELERCAGGHFDPTVVALFVEEVRRRPPAELEALPAPADLEIDLHRADGDFVLGARSFGITDSLTLLYSHRHFHETARTHAQRAAIQDRPFVIVLAQLIDLGEINRTRGFDEGDGVLRDVAAAFQRTAASCQGLAFRVSGRRLALLCAGDQTDADRIAAELRDEFRAGPELSIGSTAWQSGDSGEDVIERVLKVAQAAAAA